jgi:predicted P-loop ATPase
MSKKAITPIPQAEPEEPISIAGRWRERLMLNTKRKALANLNNALVALENAPEWSGVLAFNESSLMVMAQAQPPVGTRRAPFVWSDVEDIECAAWLQRNGIMIGRDTAGQAIQAAARKRSFHPIRDYLNSLAWDQIGRIDDWLLLYLGADESDYNRAVGAKWLIGAVARVYRPGCKNDTCLILEREQGALKSTSLNILAGEWFCDEMPELGSKDAALQMRGKWIIELAELDAMSGAEVARVKAFMSRQVDRYRPPYGRHSIDAPRECVFAGTTNHDVYLKDETGGRRFWPVRCGQIDLDSLRRDRDQLWAEAVHRFHRGGTWWLDSAGIALKAVEQQQERFNADPWQTPIGDWLEPRAEATIDQILVSCIDKPKKDWTQADKNRIARSLRALGWERFQRRDGTRREWAYHRKSPVSPPANSEPVTK